MSPVTRLKFGVALLILGLVMPAGTLAVAATDWPIAVKTVLISGTRCARCFFTTPAPCSRPERLRLVLRWHLRDQPRAALKRDVVPQPGERHDEAVL
jgi:hypothetical protein